MAITKRVAFGWLRRDSKRAIRVLLCLEAIWWAFDLWLPWPTFPISHVYDLMASIAEEWVWAILFAIDACLLVIGFRGSRLQRIGSAGLDGAVHAIIATGAVFSAPASTASGSQTILLLASYVLLEWEAMDG